MENNLQALQIYNCLQLEVQVTMGGAFYTGFSRSEISATMDIYQIPQNQRVQLFEKLMIMEQKTIQIRNKAA